MGRGFLARRLHRRVRTDTLLSAALVAASFALYAATLLPGLGYGDTAEFQRVGPTLGLAHITGYPLYTILAWLWSHLPLGGTPAWRMNLFSAAAAALAAALIYQVAREMRQTRVVAAASAAALATSATFWSQATKAEVYAFAALLQALLVLAALRWRLGKLPFAIVGLVFGLGFVHHRSTILMAPGLLLFVLLTRRPRPSEWINAACAGLGASLLYLYVPLRAEPWQDREQLLLAYVTASSGQQWFDPARLLSEGAGRPLGLLRDLVWSQLLPIGLLLALLGSLRLLRRDPALAAFLLCGYLAVFAFCSAYYAVDVAVFLIPAYVIQALLLSEGALLIVDQLPRRAALPISCLLLLLPALLLARNIAPIRSENTDQAERTARATITRPIQPRSVVVGDGFYIESLRYLQAVEGLRPDLEFGFSVDRRYILDVLAQDRAVYLLEPAPELGLAQWPHAGLWRVGSQPNTGVAMQADLRWNEGITLAGYTLEPGPYRPGDVVPILLRWTARAAPQSGYTMFVHLIGPDRKLWGQQDRPPSAAPTDQWRPGADYTEILGPTLDPSAPEGRYHVLIGWYAFPSLQRLQRAPEQATPDAADAALLGEIDIRR